jgi:hypothetical protein
MIVHEHPIPERWVIGQCEDHGGIDVVIKKKETGAYLVTLAGNVMDSQTGKFKPWREVVASDFYPTLYAAFEAFQKSYL